MLPVLSHPINLFNSTQLSVKFAILKQTVQDLCTFENYNQPFKVQRLLYVPPALTYQNSAFCPHSVFMCSVWFLQQIATVSPNSINRLVFVVETSVSCEVQTELLYIFVKEFSLLRVKCKQGGRWC
jgi:hypothetical protein